MPSNVLRHGNMFFMLQSTHKMANLTQNEICAVLCSKRQYKRHDGEKMICEILHIAGSLNSENPIQIQTETLIKHVLPAKVTGNQPSKKYKP